MGCRIIVNGLHGPIRGREGRRGTFCAFPSHSHTALGTCNIRASHTDTAAKTNRVANGWRQWLGVAAWGRPRSL